MSEDFYSVLGVGRDADEDDIKQAYRKKAAEYHPDVSDEPDAEEKFKRIKKAKEVLTDDQKRQAYDRMGHDQFIEAEKRGGFEDGAGAAGAGGVGRGGFGGVGGGPFGGSGGGIGDIFEQFFDMGGGDGSRRQSSGTDLRTELTVSLEDAYSGVEKQVSVTRPETCSTCNGEGHPPGSSSHTCRQCEGRGQVTRVQRTPLGRVQQRSTCPRCDGQGTVYAETCDACNGNGTTRERVTLTVEIPAGIRDGQTLRMEREGGAGDPGTRRGDLLIDVSVQDHPEYERDGADLYKTEPVSFPQAVYGDTVTVDTLGGTVQMDLPAGTQSGERFRLQGKGMPRLRRRGQGDLYVVVEVVTPDPGDLSHEERNALEAFAEAGGEEVDVSQGFFERIRNSL